MTNAPQILRFLRSRTVTAKWEETIGPNEIALIQSPTGNWWFSIEDWQLDAGDVIYRLQEEESV